MRLLLDTHIIVWVLRDADELGAAARSMIANADAVYASSVSWWEVSIKAAAGKLSAEPTRLQQAALDAGLLPLHVTWEHTLALHGLPALHRDPFDRMLVAQAVAEPMHLLTRDAALAAYSSLVAVV